MIPLKPLVKSNLSLFRAHACLLQASWLSFQHSGKIGVEDKTGKPTEGKPSAEQSMKLDNLDIK